jgi:hypothetical protein
VGCCLPRELHRLNVRQLSSIRSTAAVYILVDSNRLNINADLAFRLSLCCFNHTDVAGADFACWLFCSPSQAGTLQLSQTRLETTLAAAGESRHQILAAPVLSSSRVRSTEFSTIAVSPNTVGSQLFFMRVA